MHFIFILVWAELSDDILHLKAAVKQESDAEWAELEDEFEPDTGTVVDGRFLTSLQVSFSGLPVPSGTWMLKAKAVNANGESLYSEPATIVVE